jgi:hypothetical protein
MPNDEASFLFEIWRDYRPFLVARAVETLQFLTLFITVWAIRIGQVHLLSSAYFSPNFIKWLDHAEEIFEFCTIVGLMYEMAAALFVRVFLKGKVAK